jgi:hypothetical protein
MSTGGDVAKGVGIAGTVAEAVTSTAAAAGASLGAAGGVLGTVAAGTGLASGAGIATGAAAGACSVVPGIGTAACAAAAAIAAAFVAIGEAFAKLGRDSYLPSRANALSWLTLWQFLPGTLWGDVDTLEFKGFKNWVGQHTGTPVHDAVRLVRYNLIVAHLARPHAPLYNPDDRGERGKDANPYMEATRPDPHHPLTDPRVVSPIYYAAKAHGICSPRAGSMIRAKADAVHALHSLRSPQFDWTIITNDAGSDAFKGDSKRLKSCLPELRREVARARAMAGEQGPDPKLDHLLGGSTAPKAHHAPAGKPIRARDPKTAGVGSGLAEGLGFGLGLLPGLFVGGSLLALGAAVYQRAQEPRKVG